MPKKAKATTSSNSLLNLPTDQEIASWGHQNRFHYAPSPLLNINPPSPSSSYFGGTLNADAVPSLTSTSNDLFSSSSSAFTPSATVFDFDIAAALPPLSPDWDSDSSSSSSSSDNTAKTVASPKKKKAASPKQKKVTAPKQKKPKTSASSSSSSSSSSMNSSSSIHMLPAAAGVPYYNYSSYPYPYPYYYSGVPANYSGVPANYSGVPANYSGVPANYSGVPANYSGVPANYSGVPANYSGVPANYYSGVPVAAAPVAAPVAAKNASLPGKASTIAKSAAMSTRVAHVMPGPVAYTPGMMVGASIERPRTGFLSNMTGRFTMDGPSSVSVADMIPVALQHKSK